jgi:formyl-CoA transferase/succinyl-CoA--D-citramalate CoA-transferase
VDASIVESCFSMLESALPEYDKLGVVRRPNGTGLANVAPSNIYPTADGTFMVIAANLDPMFRRLCVAMEQPGLADDPRFADHTARGDNDRLLDGIIADWTRTLDADVLRQRLEAHGVVCGPINSIAEIAADPHFKARDMIREVADDRFGTLKVPGIAPRLSDTPGDIAWLGPAEPGAHNAEVLGRLGYSADEQEALRRDGIV